MTEEYGTFFANDPELIAAFQALPKHVQETILQSNTHFHTLEELRAAAEQLETGTEAHRG